MIERFCSWSYSAGNFLTLPGTPGVWPSKFYTGEGNYDIVGLSFSKNFLLDHNSLFDLLGNTPEANRAGMMFFSDHGTPVGWTNNHGYRCHTFKWANAKGQFVYVKYHFLANGGHKQFTAKEALRSGGEDPDYSKRDLREFGILTLNENPENFHRDVEQAAFSPGSMVPGIEDSPDALLQFRMFFYRDVQYHRIGINLHQIPVNCPFMASSYSSLNFDGNLRVGANHGMNPQYAPSSFSHKFRPDTAEAPYQPADNTIGRKSHYYHEGKTYEYEQPRVLYQKVVDTRARRHLHENTARLLKLVDYSEIQMKYLAQAFRISEDYAKDIYDLLPDKRFSFSEVEKLSENAEKFDKNPKFCPTMGTDKLMGICPGAPVYNV
ncbi:hypothetical protein N7534_005532 [Penicillium rubens]|nr:hypothetical protein N7534_005532 [Penicillium rubens]